MSQMFAGYNFERQWMMLFGYDKLFDIVKKNKS